VATYKDWIVEHPDKGKIKLGKLSHNELCRFCFGLYKDNLELEKLVKSFTNMMDDINRKSPNAKQE